MIKQETSIVCLPIKLTRKDIELAVNDLIKGLIYEDNNIEDDELMVRVEKKADISVIVDRYNITYQVPLIIWMKKNIRLTNIEGTGEIILEFSTKYEIESNWQIITDTSVVDYRWLEKPKIQFALFDIPIKSIANKIIEKSKAVICKSIDQQLALKVNLQDHVKKAWSKIQEPIQVSKDYNIWVSILPEKLSMTLLNINGDEISSKILIAANTNVIIGSEPNKQAYSPLPPFSYSDEIKDEVAIQLIGKSSLAAIQKIAKTFLIGKSFDFDNKSVTVEDIELYYKDNRLEVSIELSGTYTGLVLLRGEPVFNKKDKAIEIEDLEFELKTRNILMRLAGRLFRKELEKRLSKAMKFPLSHYITALEKLIQTHLEGYQVSDHIIINGKLDDIQIAEMFLNDLGFEASLLAKGKLNVEIKSF